MNYLKAYINHPLQRYDFCHCSLLQ